MPADRPGGRRACDAVPWCGIAPLRPNPLWSEKVFMISMPRFLRSAPRPRRLPPDFDPRVVDVCRAVAPFTMTSPERVAALVEAGSTRGYWGAA